MSGVSVLVMDEVHEWPESSDIIFVLIQQMLPRRPNILSNTRLLLASARSSSSASEKPLDPKWKELAKKQLKGKDPEALRWTTAEGITLKPIYTESDLEGLPLNELPGMSTTPQKSE